MNLSKQFNNFLVSVTWTIGAVLIVFASQYLALYGPEFVQRTWVAGDVGGNLNMFCLLTGGVAMIGWFWICASLTREY